MLIKILKPKMENQAKLISAFKYSFMKKKVIILSFLLAITAMSCKKYLTQLPQDSVAPQNYYQTPEQLTSAVYSIYAELGNTDESTFSRFLSLEAGNSADDITAKTGSSISAAAFNTSSSYANYNNCWNNLYNGIERANLLIQAIPKSPVADAVKNEFLGEALFLRAYFHFLLVSYFGDVPLKLVATTGVTDVSIPRTASAEVYAQIIKDMTAAETMVNTIAAQGTNTRISTTGVQGMLAKVYLHAAGRLGNPAFFAKAKEYALKVINSGAHSLNADYSKIFINQSADIEDPKECIWEIAFYSNNPETYFSYERFGSTIGINNTNTLNAFMQGAYTGTGNYYNAFGRGDNRRDWTLAPFYFNGGASANISNGTSAVPAASVWGRSMAKWRRMYQTAASIGVKNFGGTNWPLLRYADVLLIAAEADNEIQGPNDATNINFINQVRERGYGKAINGQWVSSVTITNGGSGYTVAPAVTITGGAASRTATATATISAGKVTAITITDSGANYNTVPTIAIAAPTSGITATATANLFDYTTMCDIPPASKWTKADLRNLIMLERSLELGGEGHRKLDLIRWGTYISVINNMTNIINLGQPAYSIGPMSFPATIAAPTASASTTYGYSGRTNMINVFKNFTARDTLFPIPIAELQLNPAIPNSAQNKGW